MNVLIEKKSYYLHSKAVKNVDKLWQAPQPDTSSNMILVSEIKITVTNDVSCQTDIETKFRSPSHNENSLLTAE